MPEFRIQRCLGRGGFGEVYKAVMSRGNGVEMDVAIKVLRSDLDPSSQGIQRLRDEGRLLGRMTHPSILRVYDLVVIEGHAALVSEYVAGDDLSRILKEDPIPARAAFEIVAQVAAALDAAWSHPSLTDGKPLHLVHRDIKPDNIRIDPFGAVKLLDFGIAQAARVRREAHTSVNTIMGSTQYLSPERLVQQETGPEADVFALGCTAFEILTGETLFARKSMRQMYLLMVDEGRFSTFVADRCATYAARLGPQGAALVTEMTAYDKARRPTAAELALRCDTVADGMTGPTLRSWCRTRTWSPPPEMSGPLEGQSFVVHTGSGTQGTLPPTATARHKLPSTAELALDATPDPAPTQAIRTTALTPSPVDEPTLDEITRSPRSLAPTTSLRAPSSVAPTPAAPPAPAPAPAEPEPVAPTAPLAALPPAVSSGPSPWTPEEREALASGRMPPVVELPPPAPEARTADPAPNREAEPSIDTDSSTPVVVTGPARGAPTEVPDLEEPPGTERLPLLERQRSPELWPLPMVTQPVAATEEVPTTPVTETPTGEITLRQGQRVPRRRADGTVAPRRRLVRTSGGKAVREVTAELPLAEALAEPTVRVLAPVRSSRDEPTESGREPTWPGRPPAPDLLSDEVPPPPAPDEDLLEAAEATTGSRHLPAGLHAARPEVVAEDLPTVPDDPSEVPEPPRPVVLPPAAPPTLPDTVPDARAVRPAPRPSYAPLMASAGGFAGLLLGVVLLLFVLLVLLVRG